MQLERNSDSQQLTPLPLKIVLREGPVCIPLLKGEAVNDSHELWNGIRVFASFPGCTSSAFYSISIEKDVARPSEVSAVEFELVNALKILASTWSFSGGSLMLLDTPSTQGAFRYESNAKDIERELLARTNLRRVESDLPLQYDVTCTYSCSPLATAARISKAIVVNDDIDSIRLLRYYWQAQTSFHKYRTQSSWFVDLYKVLDVLRGIYSPKSAKGNKKEQLVKLALGISKGDKSWSDFEAILNNNDLRHADILGTSPTLSRNDIDKVFQIARIWIQLHLNRKGLQA